MPRLLSVAKVRHVRWVAIGVVAVLAAGCGGNSVDWSKYPPTLKSAIDNNRDCQDLQSQFNTASGEMDSDLMGYISDRMKKVGCYG